MALAPTSLWDCTVRLTYPPGMIAFAQRLGMGRNSSFSSGGTCSRMWACWPNVSPVSCTQTQAIGCPWLRIHSRALSMNCPVAQTARSASIPASPQAKVMKRVSGWPASQASKLRSNTRRACASVRLQLTRSRRLRVPPRFSRAGGMETAPIIGGNRPGQPRP